MDETFCYVSPPCLLHSFYDTFFNVFNYIAIAFLHPISLGPCKYFLAGLSIYTDDASRSSRNVYVTGYVVLLSLMDLSS